LTDLLRAALSAGRAGVRPTQTLFARDVEEEIDSLADQLDLRFPKIGLPWRFMLVKALETTLTSSTRSAPGRGGRPLGAQQPKDPGPVPRPASGTVISSERHALSLNIFEHVAVVKPATKPDWRERLDKIATDKFWGYACWWRC